MTDEERIQLRLTAISFIFDMGLPCHLECGLNAANTLAAWLEHGTLPADADELRSLHIRPVQGNA
jgi:hypothetical protein